MSFLFFGWRGDSNKRPSVLWLSTQSNRQFHDFPPASNQAFANVARSIQTQPFSPTFSGNPISIEADEFVSD
jgi:hypothetical protein